MVLENGALLVPLPAKTVLSATSVLQPLNHLSDVHLEPTLHQSNLKPVLRALQAHNAQTLLSLPPSVLKATLVMQGLVIALFVLLEADAQEESKQPAQPVPTPCLASHHAQAANQDISVV